MRIQVVSPWYPDWYSPYSGVFVKQQVDALAGRGHSVAVEQPEIYPGPAGQVPERVWRAMRQVASRDPYALCARHRESVKAPAPVASGSGMLGRATAFAKGLEIKREFIPIGDVDVVHAHLGVPTGLACLELKDSPLVVTEHQSTLARIFAQSGGVEAYRRVVAEAAAFLCVSEHLKWEIVAAIGEEYASRIAVVPNVVDLGEVPFRSRNGAPTDHWIYVGTLFQHKGVELLLRSFKIFQQRRPRATLTLVGEGPYRSWVQRFVSANGLSQSVDLVGAVPHHEVGGYLDRADVMVHLSASETFGIASLEAIGAGLPVVSLRNGGAEDAWGDFESSVGRLLPDDAGAADVAEAVMELGDGGDALDAEYGRRQVETLFSADRVADLLLEVYGRVR